MHEIPTLRYVSFLSYEINLFSLLNLSTVFSWKRLVGLVSYWGLAFIGVNYSQTFTIRGPWLLSVDLDYYPWTLIIIRGPWLSAVIAVKS